MPRRLWKTAFILCLLLTIAGFSRAQTVIATVTVTPDPVAVAVNPLTNKIYVGSCGGGDTCGGVVTVVDGATYPTTPVNARSGHIFSLAINQVTNTIYAAGASYFSLSGFLTVINGATNTTAVINVGYEPSAIAINPVTDQIYVANSCGNDSSCTSGGTVTVIDGATQNTATVSAGKGPN